MLQSMKALYPWTFKSGTGNFGNCRHIGDGVWESKIAIGNGLRICYAITKRNAILLLSGGDKSSQKGDIAIAKTYWHEHKNRERI